MKWMIASDLHGSAFYCKKMLEAFERERADRLLLLGDLLYHGPRNDLPEGYAPKEVIPLLNGLKPALLCVRGNCDAEVDEHPQRRTCTESDHHVERLYCGWTCKNAHLTNVTRTT